MSLPSGLQRWIVATRVNQHWTTRLARDEQKAISPSGR